MIRLNAFKQLTQLILLLVFAFMPCLAQSSDKDVKALSTAVVDSVEERAIISVEEKKARRPRLKYRRGPVCMCNDGLSEAEIQAAWIKRYPQAKDSE